MADVKISELTALTSPSGGEELVVNASGTTKKITIDNLFNQDIDVTGKVTADALDVSGNVGIGNTASGFNAQADNLSVGTGSGANGITIYSGNDSSGNIFFADGTSGDDPTRGGINYNHADNSISFRVNDSPKMSIDSSGKTTFKGEIDLATGANKKISWRDADDTFRAGIQAVTSGGQMIATSSANDFALRSQSNMLFSAGGNIERMRIDAAGIVTKPYQPAFSVYKSLAQNNIPTATDTVITWGTEVYDVGSNFASNTFTAPVTGKYFLNTGIRVDSMDAVHYYNFYINTSNRRYMDIHDYSRLTADPTYWSFSMTAIVDMDAGDTATVGIYQASGATQTDIGQDVSRSFFHGYLLG